MRTRNTVFLFQLILIISCSISSSSAHDDLPSVQLQEYIKEVVPEELASAGYARRRTIVFPTKHSVGSRGVNGGQSAGQGNGDASHSPNSQGGAAVIPVYAANAHHNNHHKGGACIHYYAGSLGLAAIAIASLLFW